MHDYKPLYPNILAELARNNKSVRDLAWALNMTSQNLYGKLRGTVSFKEQDIKGIQQFFKEIGGGDLTLDYLLSNAPSEDA